MSSDPPKGDCLGESVVALDKLSKSLATVMNTQNDTISRQFAEIKEMREEYKKQVHHAKQLCDRLEAKDYEIEALKADVKLLERRNRELEFQQETMRAHAAAKTGDTVQDEQWDAVWKLVHEDDNSWEYPGQVIRQVQAVMMRLARMAGERLIE